jgi:hypothetical protein
VVGTQLQNIQLASLFFVATGRVNVTAKARAWVKLSSRMIVYNPQAGFGDEFSWPSKTGTFVS